MLENKLDFSQCSVLVVGDIMLDKYVYGQSTRKSPEAPIPILDFENSETKLGGAANVALNAGALGSKVHLVGIVGEDFEGSQIDKLLTEDPLITTHFLAKIKDRYTTVKTRFISDKTHLLRVDKEHKIDISTEQSILLFERIKTIINDNKITTIILEDYDKGLLTPKLIEQIISYSNSLKIPICIDPKFKNASIYSGATLFKPNLKELNSSLNSNFHKTQIEQIIVECKKLVINNHFEQLWVTLGSAGILYVDNQLESKHFKSEYIEVADVCGAGDAVIAFLSLGITISLNPNELGKLANYSGALVCKNVGVYSISIQEINQKINLDLKNN